MSDQLATVVALPMRGARRTAEGAWRRLVADDVDDWGRDDGFVTRLWSLAGLRWDTSVGGAEHLPRRGGALIVVNARRLSLAPVMAALALGEACDRPVRFVGRPDVAPAGPALQRLGGLLPDVGEVAGALRSGQLVVLGADHTPTNAHCGRIDHRFVGAALDARVPVLAAATSSAPVGRAARIELTPPLRPARRRRGPLEELELADALRHRIDHVLLESDASSIAPLEWVNGLAGWARAAAGVTR